MFLLSIKMFTCSVYLKEFYPFHLLLLEKDGKFHYCLITNFQAFMRRQTKKESIYCRKCLCAENPCRIKIKSNTQLFRKQFSATLRLPFIIYAEIEAIFPRVNESQNKACTRKIEKQSPCDMFAISLNTKGNVYKVLFS